MNILVADDVAQIRKMIRITLEREGHTIAEAEDGNQAMRVASDFDPDLIITDIVMPNKEGLETIMEFRRSHPGVPIIAISGGGLGSAVDYLPMAKKMGAAATLNKPFGPSQILEVIDSIMAI